MKINYIKVLLFLFCFCNFLYSQQTPIDFSDSSHNFNVWGGSTFTILSGPIDSSNDTGQFFRSASTQEQGHYIDLSRPINLDVEDEITLRFYAFDANAHNVVVKLENGTNPNIEVGVTSPSNQNAWSNLTFDFSTVSGTGLYNRLTIRIDDGSSVPGAFRIDDINDGSVATDPNALDVIYTDLVWSDEFNSTNRVPIDDTKWHHQTILPRDFAFFPNQDNHALCCWFNGEEQHYTDRIENSYMENGFLNIVAIKEQFTDQGETKQYTSARLNSKFAFTYGRVDVRAKLPSGDGTWPAIWTLGKNIDEFGNFWHDNFGTTSWPACGEIDIMEHGLHATNETSSAIHTPSSFGNTINTDRQFISDVANDFHVYSVNWSPNQITFLVDNVGYYTYNPAVKDANTWPFDLEQYLILNIAMGGISGTIDPSFTQSPMVVDYVRVYQNASLSIDENTLNNIKIYPNPVTDIVFINTELNITEVSVFDSFGKLIIKEMSPKESIDVSKLKSGLYFLQLNTELGSTSKKLIKK